MSEDRDNVVDLDARRRGALSAAWERGEAFRLRDFAGDVAEAVGPVDAGAGRRVALITEPDTLTGLLLTAAEARALAIELFAAAVLVDAHRDGWTAPAEQEPEPSPPAPVARIVRHCAGPRCCPQDPILCACDCERCPDAADAHCTGCGEAFTDATDDELGRHVETCTAGAGP